MAEEPTPSTASIWYSRFRSSHMTGPSTTCFWSLSVNNGYFLHLCDTGLLAIPATWKDGVKIGALAGARMEYAAQGLLGATPGTDNVTTITDAGNQRWLRFPLDAIEAIACRRKTFWRRKITIRTLDFKQSAFGLFIRNDYDLIVQTMRTMYGDLVREE